VASPCSKCFDIVAGDHGMNKVLAKSRTLNPIHFLNIHKYTILTYLAFHCANPSHNMIISYQNISNRHGPVWVNGQHFGTLLFTISGRSWICIPWTDSPIRHASAALERWPWRSGPVAVSGAGAASAIFRRSGTPPRMLSLAKVYHHLWNRTIFIYIQLLQHSITTV
jgi:hypothetical protein